MDADEILKMIEAVDPSDHVGMTKIDANVRAWLNGHTLGATVSGSKDAMKAIFSDSYSRSRDALKKIRPKGWDITYTSKGGPMAFLTKGDFRTNISLWAKSEELTELYAIIQAIGCERGVS